MKMKQLKSIGALFLTPLFMLFPNAEGQSVSAYEEPHGICLSLETKEIDINDIPGDRVVQVGLYTENTPPYKALTFLLNKDSRLEYIYLNCISSADETEIGGMSYEYGSDYNPDLAECNVTAPTNGYIDHNGLLVYVNVRLPEDVKAGDWFGLDLLWDIYDVYDRTNEIVLENDWDAVFGNSSFSEVNGGGIRITKEEEPPPPPPQNNDKPSGGGNSGGNSGGSSGGSSGGNSGGGNNNEDGGGNSNGGGDKPAVKTTAAKTAKPKATATTAAEPATEPITEPEETTTAPEITEAQTAAQTTTETAAQTVTTAAIDNDIEKEEDGKNNFWIIIASTAAAAAVVSIAVWASRRSR